MKRRTVMSRIPAPAETLCSEFRSSTNHSAIQTLLHFIVLSRSLQYPLNREKEKEKKGEMRKIPLIPAKVY